MNRGTHGPPAASCGGPHTRGDEPATRCPGTSGGWWSPHGGGEPADPDPAAVPQRWSPHAEWRDHQEWSDLVSYAATVGRGLYLRQTRSSTIDHVVRPRSAKAA